ncbi:protein far-red impaired response 1 [Phtheirospermum japonicum]|uniref:Protein far-red impaired response 1 n=1 Tax=Phtheirospermum japonicum TaxID=374723 RepID=A0A830D8G1_9LAMI|nr:protein far-red impaired response 1 [Phtheirospermum japonicum]
MDIDEREMLLNMLWVYPRARVAYQDVHDVVCYGPTYLINKYNMPLCMISGISPHHQFILLGCCFIEHESMSSLKWIFKNQIEAMDEIQPTCIITDQVNYIRNVLRDVMPLVIHLWCLCHIMRK